MRIDVDELTLEKVKDRISEKTGVPVDLLNGETVEENIVRAKTLLALKQKNEAERPKTVAEEFSAWMKSEFGLGEPDEKKDVLSTLESDIMTEFFGIGYPSIRDAGELDSNTLSDGGSAKEQFSNWFRGQW